MITGLICQTRIVGNDNRSTNINIKTKSRGILHFVVKNYIFSARVNENLRSQGILKLSFIILLENTLCGRLRRTNNTTDTFLPWHCLTALASNKQQQPPWKAQNKATPTTLVTVTFRKLSMCCRHFASRDSNPVFASKREHSTLQWLIQCYFRAVVLGSGKSLLLISRSTRKEIASRIPCLLQDSRNKLTRRTRWEREWKKTRLWLASLTDITTCPFLPTTLVNLISILCDSLWARRSEVPRDLH